MLRKDAKPKSMCQVATTSWLGKIKLGKFKEKSYITKQDEDGSWRLVVEYRNDVSQHHQRAAEMTFEYAKKQKCTKQILINKRPYFYDEAIKEPQQEWRQAEEERRANKKDGPASPKKPKKEAQKQKAEDADGPAKKKPKTGETMMGLARGCDGKHKPRWQMVVLDDVAVSPGAQGLLYNDW